MDSGGSGFLGLKTPKVCACVVDDRATTVIKPHSNSLMGFHGNLFCQSGVFFFLFKNRIMWKVFSGCGEGRTDLWMVTACPHQPGAPPQRDIPSRWTSRGHSTHFETLCPSVGGSGSLLKQSRATVTTNLRRRESGPSAQAAPSTDEGANSKLKLLPDAEDPFY